ncbi:crustacean hyperglycemic hormones 7 isoform X2 [Venturia canescens]|uniref:crustacean hyperglycemic hormones 7 isoform X2 n=1 Tax=Venturia canescens TaxID=32260 RepID=UPI001C9C615B|nr:crustacean hyperglycemic hormones 7 isoform X2 [Venturia canescens]
MLATMEEITMMYRPQSSSLLTSNSSSSSRNDSSSSSTSSSNKRSNNCSKSRLNSSSSVCTSSLAIISRRCVSSRTKISTSGNTHSSIYPRCTTTTTMTGATSVSSSSCPVLLSVLAWSVALLLISSCLGIADAGVLMGHPLGKRSFMQLQCKGIYDGSIFARLDRICEDCYYLFREPTLHTLCGQDCFSTKYFTSCIQALLLEDEKEKFQEMADYLGRRK